MTSEIYSSIALGLSLIALYFTFRRFLLKAGTKIFGSYSIASSISCNDRYVSSVALENHKDRATIIYCIYLKIGNNYFLEIENFEDIPLILKPFETYQKDFDPIAFYEVSVKKIGLDRLLEDSKVRKQLVLSTSRGKYEVKSWIRRWNPIVDFFKNHMTAVIRPVRSTYKGSSYGSNVKYLVEFRSGDGHEEVVPLHPEDYRRKIFKSFRLTKESLESIQSLEAYLQKQKWNGILNVASIKVHDLDTWRKQVYEKNDMKVFEARYYNKFQYLVLGRIGTAWDDYKLKRENRKRQKKA